MNELDAWSVETVITNRKLINPQTKSGQANLYHESWLGSLIFK
jgi:hypothetical protein